MTISEKIRETRKKTGLSQEALGAQLGVSRQAITKWENGTAMPDPDKIVLLSECFGVTTDYLLKDKITQIETLNSHSVIEKRKVSLLLKIGIPLFTVAALVWLVVWYLSVRYPVSFLNWDGSIITGFWGFLEIHKYLFEFFAVSLCGLAGMLLVAVYIVRKKRYIRTLLLWLRSKVKKRGK